MGFGNYFHLVYFLHVFFLIYKPKYQQKLTTCDNHNIIFQYYLWRLSIYSFTIKI